MSPLLPRPRSDRGPGTRRTPRQRIAVNYSTHSEPQNQDTKVHTEYDAAYQLTGEHGAGINA